MPAPCRPVPCPVHPSSNRCRRAQAVASLPAHTCCPAATQLAHLVADFMHQPGQDPALEQRFTVFLAERAAKCAGRGFAAFCLRPHASGTAADLRCTATTAHCLAFAHGEAHGGWRRCILATASPLAAALAWQELPSAGVGAGLVAGHLQVHLPLLGEPAAHQLTSRLRRCAKAERSGHAGPELQSTRHPIP